MTTNEAVAAAYLAMISWIGFEVCVLMIWHGLRRLGDAYQEWLHNYLLTPRESAEDACLHVGDAYLYPAFVCASCKTKCWLESIAVHGLDGRRFCSVLCRENYLDTTRKYSLKYRKYVERYKSEER